MSSTRVISSRFGAVWGCLVVLFVITPLVAIICVSVSAADYISFPWDEGFSLNSYAEIPNRPEFLSAAWNSVKLAFYASVVALLVGLCASLAVVRHSFPGRGLVVLLGSSPLFVPQVLTGLALSLALAAAGIGSSLLLLLVGHIVITIPYVLRVSTAALTGFNMNQEWAAQNLGAGKIRAFLSVTLPQIRSGIIAGAIMAFIVSFDNVALSLFLAGPGYGILPVYLYHYASNQFDGVAAAVSVAMIAASILGIIALQRLVGLDKLFGGEAELR